MSRSAEWEISGYYALFIVMLAAAFLAPVVSAANGAVKLQTTPILYPTRTMDPDETIPPHPLMLIQNTTGYLESMNPEMHWGLSGPQITEYGKKLEDRMQGKYSQRDQGWFDVYSYSEFANDVGSTIGLDEEQKLALLYQEWEWNSHKIAFYEYPGYVPPEIPHFFASGKVLDNTGRPVSSAQVRFLSDLTTEGQNLSSTAVSDREGSWWIKIAWGKYQNITVTKDGYKPLTEEITFENETNVMDFELTPQPKPVPVSPEIIVISVIFGFLVICFRNKDG